MVQSKGERIIRTSFNPTEDYEVSRIKNMAAALIDTVDMLKLDMPEGTEFTKNGTPLDKSLWTPFNEFNRLKALAVTSIEQAAMWAVKAATVRIDSDES